MTWLHFIGKSFYSSIAKFEKEARAIGISRRVDKRILLKMNYGDKVYLFQGDKKRSICFGFFIIDSISGDIAPVINELKESGLIELTSPGGIVINRGCGSYMAGPTYACSDSNITLNEIAQLLLKYESKNILLCGSYHDLDSQIKTTIPFQMGYRAFDENAFFGAFNELNGKARKVVRGQFYVEDPDFSVNHAFVGHIQEITNYSRKG